MSGLIWALQEDYNQASVDTGQAPASSTALFLTCSWLSVTYKEHRGRLWRVSQDIELGATLSVNVGLRVLRRAIDSSGNLAPYDNTS
jgi:hypothetical protein